MYPGLLPEHDAAFSRRRVTLHELISGQVDSNLGGLFCFAHEPPWTD